MKRKNEKLSVIMERTYTDKLAGAYDNVSPKVRWRCAVGLWLTDHSQTHSWQAPTPWAAARAVAEQLPDLYKKIPAKQREKPTVWWEKYFANLMRLNDYTSPHTAVQVIYKDLDEVDVEIDKEV